MVEIPFAFAIQVTLGVHWLLLLLQAHAHSLISLTWLAGKIPVLCELYQRKCVPYTPFVSPSQKPGFPFTFLENTYTCNSWCEFAARSYQIVEDQCEVVVCFRDVVLCYYCGADVLWSRQSLSLAPVVVYRCCQHARGSTASPAMPRREWNEGRVNQ